MNQIKKIIFPLLTIVTYLSLLITVFFWSDSISDIWTTIWLQVILFVFLPFVLITQDSRSVYKSARITIVIGVFRSIIAYLTLNGQNSIFLLFSHLTIAWYLRSRHYRIKLSKKRYYRWTSQHGLWIVATLLTITYASTIRIAGATINLNCDDLYNQSIGAFNQLMPSLDEESRIITRLSQASLIGSKSLGEVLGTHNGSWEVIIFSTATSSFIDSWSTSEISWDNGLLAEILSYQHNLITNVTDNQTLVNQQICDITLTQINSLMSKSNAQLIAFILLNVLLLVFIRVLLLIIGLINYGIIQLLFAIKRYRREELEGTYEKITL